MPVILKVNSKATSFVKFITERRRIFAAAMKTNLAVAKIVLATAMIEPRIEHIN